MKLPPAAAEPAIETDRLVLCPWRRTDLDAMAAWPPFTAPLDQVWNWPRRLSLRGTLDLFFLTHELDASRRAWTILEHGTPIGLLQIKDIRPAPGDAFLGIALGAPWIGKGYGREALAAFLDHYFGGLGFGTARLEVALANTRARRLYDALGFRETGRFWRDAGSLDEFLFLDDPEYADLRPYFRWTADGVYQLCAEMELGAARWRTLDSPDATQEPELS